MPFKKGQSGNPGGRPKVAKDVQALARTHSKAAIETLVKCMQTADPRTRVAAALNIARLQHCVTEWESPFMLRELSLLRIKHCATVI